MSIWQTKNWQDMLKSANQVESTFEIDGVFIEKRSIWLGEYWMFILWVRLADIQWSTYKKAIELCKKENTLFIQFETIHYWSKINNSFSKLKNWFYKKFITPYTAVIDLDKSLDEILANMKPKWRYNIRLAEKKWVEVLEVEKTSENIEKFYKIMEETTSRDWFNWNLLSYYVKFLNNIPSSKLLLAYYNDEVIAGWIFTYNNSTAIYYYWASSSNREYRNLMAPYLLQWKAINIWKELWCNIYDFLWVSTPNSKKSSLSWVTDFKKKFTSDIREVSESYIYINKIFKYKLIKMLKFIKRYK